MVIPHGATPPKGADCVLLKKAVYGLKQAPREWNSTFVEFLFKLGFKWLTPIFLSLCMVRKKTPL